MKPIRGLIGSRRGFLGVLVIAVTVLGSASSVALAKDNSEQSSANDATTETSTSSDQTTSTTDPTTSTSDPTTSSDSTTTTSDDLGSGGESGKGSGDYSRDQTTTTSEALNELTVGPRVATTTTTVTGQTGRTDKGCAETWASTETWDLGTIYVLLVDTVTIVVTPETQFTGNWSADAPFTGQIKVKSGQADTWVPVPPNSTTGTIVSPGLNNQGQTQAISHVEFCGGPGTTTTQTTTTQTTTTETTTTTDTTTTDTTTTGTTGTTTGTGGTAGTTGTGGTAGTTQAGGGGGGAGGGGGGGAAEGAAAQAAAPSGGLPFSGLHAPLMVLIAAGMVGLGLTLRKRVNGSA